MPLSPNPIDPSEFKRIFTPPEQFIYWGPQKIEHQLLQLKKQGIVEDSVDAKGANILHYAAQYNDIHLIKHLIHLGFKWDKRDHNQLTLVHYAIRYSSYKVINTIWNMDFELVLSMKERVEIKEYALSSHTSLFLRKWKRTIVSDELKNENYSLIISLVNQHLNLRDLSMLVEEYFIEAEQAWENRLYRNHLISPLIDYYKNQPPGCGVLTSILSQKRVDIYTLENQLNTLLQQAEHGNKSYSHALLVSRVNTAQVTLNKNITVSQEGWEHLQKQIKLYKKQKITYWLARLVDRIARIITAGAILTGIVFLCIISNNPLSVMFIIGYLLPTIALFLGTGVHVLLDDLSATLKEGYVNIKPAEKSFFFFNNEKKESIDATSSLQSPQYLLKPGIEA